VYFWKQPCLAWPPGKTGHNSIRTVSNFQAWVIRLIIYSLWQYSRDIQWHRNDCCTQEASKVQGACKN
jgi:hypothetical protein